jgi:hypothetical protein
MLAEPRPLPTDLPEVTPTTPAPKLWAGALALLVACSGQSAPAAGEAASSEGATPAAEAKTTTAAEGSPAPEGPPAAGPIPESWVDDRYTKAKERLEASEGGALIWAAIEAQGGLRPWLSSGTIGFEFDYQPYGQPERRMHTKQRVDLWRARAVHQEVEDEASDAEARFGWNGEVAWITPSKDAFPITPRFWALTPYYFVGIPFVLADPGTRFERLDDAELDGKTWNLVKVTFSDGTGDAPDDYYIVYLDPDSHALHALRYVVSYPGFEGVMFEEGGHTPETLMRYTEPTQVDGLGFHRRLDTWKWNADDGVPGDPRVKVEVGDHRLGFEVPAADFAPPEGAVVLEEM